MALTSVTGFAAGATLHLDTQVGKGSTFHVLFPVCNPAGRSVAFRSAAESSRGRLLIIDDKVAVRQVLSKMLSNSGYDVQTAGVALRPSATIVTITARSMHAVLLDIATPKMNGRDCLNALRQINPGVRAVLTFGADHDQDSRAFLDSPNVDLRKKPYQPRELAAAVRRALIEAGAEHQPGRYSLRIRIEPFDVDRSNIGPVPPFNVPST